MKKIIHRYAAFICLAVLICFTPSCRNKREKEVFEKPATERIQQGIDALREKLKASPQGWIISYRPSSEETGTYQFLFRFVNDTEVETSSDFSSGDSNWKKSEYSILTGSTTKLSFSTANPLHKLSDSGFSPIPGSRGSGLKGDFEFLYYGENEQGDLVFRANRTNKTLLFKKATENSSKDIASSVLNLEKLLNRRTVYQALIESKDGQIKQSRFSFPYNARVLKIQGVVEEEEDGERVKSFEAGYTTGYGLTPEGIFLDSVKRSNGQVLKNIQLKWNEESSRFETALGDGTLLAIGDINAPIIPLEDHKLFLNPLLTAGLLFFYKDPDIGGLTTPAFEALFDELKPMELSNPPRFDLYRQRTYGRGNKIDAFFLRGAASVSGGGILERLAYEDRGDRLVITRRGFVDPRGSVKPVHRSRYNEFMNFLTDPQGFYVENLGRATRYSNFVFTFTSVRDPSIRMAFYHSRPN